LNTSLVDVATGECAYDVTTTLAEDSETPSPESLRWPSSGSSAQTTREAQTTSKSSATIASASSAFPKQSHDEESDPLRRKTTITDATGTIVAEIQWKGRRPSITICDEKVGALADLFGSTVPFLPKILAIPTRFDTEYIWTATPDSLTLFDYDTESVRGTFYQNVFRIPSKSKGFKVKLSPSFSQPPASPASSSPSFATTERKSPNSTFFPAHVPGLGSSYLEFESHPLAHDVEIILSFLLMEMLRRGRFDLTPYNFEKPKLWHFKEAKDLILGRLRRHSL